MPIINKQYVIELESFIGDIGGDPSQYVHEEVVDLSLELSKLYSKNIRQGQNFKVKGVQTALIGANSEYDVGLAAATKFSYCPTTKHTTKAWKDVMPYWHTQKKLRAGAVGNLTKFDDLEYAYSLDFINARTSSMFQGGLADNDEDALVIFGSSSESTNTFSLEDHYQSMVPAPQPSRFGVTNAVVKEPKFDDYFPNPRSFWATGEASSMASFETQQIPVPLGDDLFITTTHLSGSNMTADIHLLPEPANVFCGLLKIQTYVIPDDTISQVEDQAILHLTIWVDSWTPLYRPRSRKGRSRGKKNSYNRRSRRTGRGRRRRRY